MKRIISLIAVVAMLFLGAGCAHIDAGGTIHKDPAALHGDYSGKDSSGSFAIIRDAGDIPHVPESNGKTARWSQVEVDQVAYLDAVCQQQLFEQLPGWAQAIAKEGGWTALAVAIGEGGFAAAFPGAEMARYFLGGLGYGAAAGANNGRIRQDSSEKVAVGYCVLLQVWDARNRYHILEGINVIPWYGNGHTELPGAENSSGKQPLRHVDQGDAPPTLR